MKPIERNEVLGIGDYEAIRPHFRSRVIEEKKLRRLAVGPHATAVFENRDTALLQIQEMLRTERITKEASILHEIATYNELVPGPGEITATLMIEIDDRDTRERFLVEAAGLERAIFLEVDGARRPGKVADDRVQTGRTTAVHYVRFEVPGYAGGAAPKAIAIVVDHPAYRVRAEASPALVAELGAELTAG